MSNFSRDYTGNYQNGGSSYGSSGDFSRLTNIISNNVQRITNNVLQLNSWLSLYGTKQDTAELHEKLEQLQQQTSQLAKDTSKYAKELGRIQLSPNPTEMRQQKAQRDRLIDEFMKILSSFQKFQREEKQTVASQARPPSYTSVAYDPFADGSPSDDWYESSTRDKKAQTTLQIDDGETDLEQMRERESALRQLESDIVDINQIFKDLGTLVHEQGDMIDSIEANVETASVSVQQGNEQLRQAANYQNKARKKKCICLIIVLIVLAVIAIILGVTLSKK